MGTHKVRSTVQVLLFLLFVQWCCLGAEPATDVPSQKKAQAQSLYLNLPLSFERQGAGANERYVAQGSGYMIGLEKGRAVIGLPAAGSPAKGAPGRLISLGFVGGKEVNATPEDELPGKVNRYIGNDPKQWKTGLATFGKVAYRDVYPGIDVVYYGNQKQLEFDFVVKPGTDPSAIRLKIGGARKLRIDGSGALVVDDGGGRRNDALKIALPEVYQETGGARRKIAGRYELRGNDEVAFAVESWDRTKPLIIDPSLSYPRVVYSGLIGGGTSSSSGYGIALDSSGDIYISGNTYASDFPTANPAQAGASLSGDGFVMKINSAGTALVYSTYLGGSNYDGMQAMAVDSTGAAWVTGQTQSSDFPVLNALQSSFGGNQDAVVAKFSSSGALQFSTYLGGNNYDQGYFVAVDSSNNAYIAGTTQSTNFSTTTGALLTSLAGYQNGFVVKFNSSATRVYSTLVGGTSYDNAYGVAVDSSGDAYLTGLTYSTSFVGAPGGGAQTANAGGQDAYVAKLNPAGSALLYFTFLGGAGSDSGQAIALDSSNNAYIAGTTSSTGLATSGAAQTAPSAGLDGFIAKLNSSGSAFTYCSYLGGNRQDYILALGVDASGNAYVGGYTDSNVFPAVAALQPNYPGNPISLFRTTTTGTSWSGFDTGISGEVFDVSADPVTSGVIVAATENGIFRTTNGGSSWTQSLPLAYVLSLARSPVSSTTIYALNPNNIYVSTDDGVTWQYQGNINNGYFEGLVADPLTASTVYAYSQSDGLYVSTNSGVNWTLASSALPSSDIPALVAASDGSLYASVSGYGIYKSTNHAGSWTAVNTGLPSGGYFYSHSLAVSGTTVYAGYGTLYQTTNGGTSWTMTPGFVPNGAYVIGVSPTNANLVYATAYGGGVYVSTDAGTTWNAVNTGVSNVPQITEFAFDPRSASTAYIVAPVYPTGFVAELNYTGSTFAYSSWFGSAGGNSYTEIYGLTATSSGDIFVTGYTSADTGGAFPGTTTAFAGSTYGAFVARISTSSAACSVTLGPASQTVPGYTQTLGLSAIAPGGCTWTASSNQSWATITRGGTSDSGIDAITVQMTPNTTGATRTATITAGSGSATIVQADSSCVYMLSTNTLNVPASGETTSIGLTTTSGCPWSVTNTYPSAVTITSGASGTGNGTINLSVATNYGVSAESFYLTIGSTQLSINQAGGCSYTFTPSSASFGASGGTGSFGVTASSEACSWTASPSNSWITLTGNTSGTGNGTVNYSVAANSGATQMGTIGVGGYNFTITESGQGITITSPMGFGTVSLGQIQFPLHATGGSGTYTWSVVSGALPTGIHIANVPGSSSAQPGLVGIASATGNYSSTLMVTDGTYSQTQAFTAKITAFTLKDYNLPDAFVGASYSYTFAPFNNAGSVTFSVGAMPAGMSLSSAGVLSGTPTIAGNSGISFSVSDGTDTIYRSYQLQVYTVDLTTSGTLPNATQGSSYSTTLAASGGTGGYTYSVPGGLPPGLSLSGAVISGTVSASAGKGLYSFNVTVTDSTSESYQKTMSIDVVGTSPNQIQITLGPIDDAVLGVPYGWQIPICCGGTAPYTWTASGLPSGMSIRYGSGVTSDYITSGYAEIWGVAETAGNYSITLTVTDSVGASATVVVPFHVSLLNLAPGYNLLNGTINTAYSTSLQIIGGVGSGYSVTQIGGYLPDGLTLNTGSVSSGNFSVTGTPVENGGFDPIFKTSDGTNTLTRNNYFNISNVSGGISINNNSSLPSATVGANYSFQLNACCVTNYSWSNASGNLPNGITLSTGGLLSGTPTTTGTYTFLVKAADTAGVAATGYRQFTFNVTPLAITTGPLNFGNVGTSYTTNFAATGGTGTLTWSLPIGNYLPPGLMLATNGTLSGTPTATGQFTFDVMVTDQSSNTDSGYYTINIYAAGSYPPVTISTGSNLGTFHLGTNQIALSASNGNGTYTWNLVSGTLPTGLALRTDVPTFFGSNQQAGLIGVATVPGNYSFTLSVTSAGQTVSQAFTMRVSALDLQDATPPDGFVSTSYTYTFTPIANAGAVTFAVNSNSTNGAMPPGLTLSSTGVLSGTPTAAGTYTIAMNINDGTDTQYEQYTLYIYAVNITTTAPLPNATQGSSYSTTLAASGGAGGYTFAVVSGNLPGGLSLSTGGTISGTVTAGAGLYGFSISATDTNLVTYTKNMSLDVVSSPVSPMQINNRLWYDPVLGDHYGNVQSVCCGGTAPFTWTVTGLPPGLTTEPNSNSYFNYPATPGSVQIYGVPQQAGTYNVNYKVTDATGASTSLTVPMHVSNLDVEPVSGGGFNLPNGTIHTSYSSTFRILGGTGPYTVTRNSNGELPNGLSLNGLTVSGTPLENGNNFNSPWFVFSDSASNTLTRYQNIFISGGTSTITINGNGFQGYNLGSVPVGASYSTQFSACCVSSYVWSLDSSSAALPAGLSLSSSGQLSGTPTTAGTYTFLIDAAQSGVPSNVGVKSFVLTVTPITVTTTSLPYGVVGTSYTASLTATGGTGSLTWVQTLTEGSDLPPGLTLAASGAITGTPTSAGLYNVTVQVTDGSGYTAIANYVIDVYLTGPPLDLASPSTGPYAIGANQLQIQLVASGGTPPYHYSLTPSANVISGMRIQDGLPLPTNFPSTVTGGFLGLLGPGNYSTSLRVTDSTGATFDRPFSFSVLPVDIVSWQNQLPPAVQNASYSFQLTPYGGSGTYVWGVSGNLPAGLSINSSTGVISGTPTVTGTFITTITLGDANATASGVIGRSETLTIYPLAITDTAQLSQATANSAYSHQFSAPNCGTGCAWSVASGNLPSGFTLTSAGLLSGTYTSATGTISSFTIQAAGSAGTTQKIFTLPIAATVMSELAITTSISASSVQGTSNAIGLFAAGGKIPYTFTLQSGTLPPGVTLQGPGETIGNLLPGVTYLAGWPEVAGTYNFTIKVTDAASNTATKSFSWQISPIELLYTNLPITTPVSNPLIFNQSYSQQLLVIGGTGSYTFVPAGPVYPGLTLNPTTGLVSGTPTNTGNNSTLTTITDSGSNSESVYLSISAASNSNTTITLGGPAAGTVIPLGFATTYSLSPSGGTAPYTITATTALPAGFAILSGDTITTSNSFAYALQAIPEARGTYTFTLQATDANGVTGEKTYTVIVPGFSYPYTTSLGDGSVGASYSQQIYSFDPSSTETVAVASGSVLPPGLTVSSSGLLSGTPTTAGSYSFVLSFSDSSGTSNSTFQLRISSIALTNARFLQVAITGVPYSYQVPSTGGTGTVTWTATGLPSGLSISTSGLVSGTTNVNPGTYSVTLTATDGVVPVSSIYTLFVRYANVGQLSVSIAPLNDAVVGKLYAFAFAPSGGIGPYTISVATGSTLPPGLSLIPSASIPGAAPGTYDLFGSPTTAGTYTFSLVIADGNLDQITIPFTLNVRTVDLVSGNPPNAIIGTAYNFQITAIGGTAPYTFTMAQSAIGQETLPPGLTMSTSGLISGTPTSTGKYVFLLTAKDSLGATYTAQLSLTCTNSSGLYVTSIDFPYMGVGIGATQSFTTSGTSTYIWSVVGGSLPPGTFLRTSGSATNLGGQPTAPGNYTFTLRATDQTNSGNYADHIFNQTVGPMQIVSPADQTPVTLYLPPAQVGVSYSQSMFAAGGAPPYTFTESTFNSDLLPAGLTLSTSGVLSGTPTTAGVYFVRPIVTDSANNQRTSFAYQLVVTTIAYVPLIPRSLSVVSNASVGTPFVFALDRLVEGGTPPYTWSVTGLPAGLSVVPGGNGISSYITGIATTAGSSAATLTVNDNSGQTVSGPITLTVSPLALTPGSVPSGIVGTSYSATLTPSGGTAPYTVSLATVSDLPPGLTLSSSGVLSGTPTYAGNFLVSVVVNDNGGNTLNKLYEVTLDDAAGEAPALSVSPKPITISFTPGQSAPSVALNVASTSTALSFNDLVTGIPGASLTASSGTTPATPTLNFNTDLLSLGTYSGLVAAQSANSANYGEAVPVTLTVTAPSVCNTTLMSSANPSTFGQNVTLSSTISCAGGTGSITFMDGSTPLGSPVTLINGAASFSTTALSVGSHSLTAVYSGDSVFAGSTSGTVTQVVNMTAPTVSLGSSPNPSVFGQSVTLTATLSASGATGTVTFKDAGKSIGTGTVSSGVATFTTSTLIVGTHSLTATYGGDSNYSGSTSSSASQVVNQVTTSTTLMSSPAPSTFGQSVAFTATVTPSAATGSVSFVDGSTTIGTIMLANGTAVLNISTLSVATHSVTATYSGDTNDAGSSSMATSQTVNKAVSQTVVTSSLNPSTYGAGVTFTATVTPSSATGTVNFLDGSTSLGTGTLSGGIATISPALLAAVSHSITASYVGDGNDTASTSTPLTQTVNQAQPAVYLTSTPDPSVTGQTVTLTATVVPSTATGSIIFNDGTNPIATVQLSGGTASTTTSTLSAGAHNLTASYSGDSNFLSAASVGGGPALFFTSAIPGTILDSTGQGTGFTTRLPGTGTSIATNDPNLTLNTATGTLTWQTTASDLNNQVNLPSADFIGFPLSAAGVTLNEDFSLSATFQNVQYGLDFDQFGLFVGTNGSNAFRGGVDVHFANNAFSVQTVGGVDQNTQENTALVPNVGDTVTITLSRNSGTWAMSIQNLTNPALSGSIPLVQPTYLNGVTGLVAGIFGSNAENTTVRTETISGFSFTGGKQNVDSPATTTSLTASPNPSYPGQTVTLTATVSPSAATGTVAFMDGSTTLGTAAVNLGTATFTTTALALGSHSLTASYGGNGAFTSSSSNTVTQSVTQTPTTTGLMSSLNPSSFGQNVTFTASVSPSSATGMIMFSDGSTPLVTAMLSNGTASFSTAGLTAGNHSITASYAGNGAYTSSVSNTVMQTVNQAATTTTLSSSPNPAPTGQSVTLQATVTPSSATGMVTFYNGGSPLGMATLSLGSASVTVTLSPGGYSLTATYGGDSNNASSTSSPVSQSVSFPTLTISTSSLPSGMVNQSYGPVTFQATGGSGNYTWSASGLPTGLSLSASGSLSGVSSAPFSGSVSVTVTDNISRSTASESLTLSIVASQLNLSGPTTLGSVVSGSAISATFMVSGGVSPYTWSLTGAGLSVDSSGHVTGTAGAPGTYSVSISVTDSQNASASVTVGLSSFGLTSGGLPPGTTTTTYSATVSAAGGMPPYTFTATGLPPGVSFSGGTFSGTPTATGTYSVSVKASDSGGLSVTGNYSVTVTGPAALSIYTTMLGNATAGQSYSSSLSATGGTTPYTWSQSGGVIPAGISLGSDGTVSGMPTVPGPYSIGVRVTDANGNYVVGSASLTVLPAALQITNGGSFPSAIAGSDYPAQTLMATGGVPPYTFAINGALPSGLNLLSSQISGSPTTAGNYSFTVKATDSQTPPATGLLGVSLNVRPQSADLVLASSSVSFSVMAGTTAAPAAASIGVASSVVTQSITYSVSTPTSWLTVSPGSNTPGVVSVALNNAALGLSAAGSPYSGSVVVTCTSGTCSGNAQTITVGMSVAAAPPLLSLGASLISFGALTSNPLQQSGSLPISNGGGGQLQINSAASDSPWLTVSSPPSAAIAPGPGTSLTVTADSTGLAAGYYRGVITVNSNAGMGTAVVTLFVSGAATLTLGPAGSQFSLPQGGALGLNSGSFAVNASSGASAPFTAAVTGAPWLSLSNSSGTATTGVPAIVSYTIDQNAAGLLALGTYYGTIRVSANGVVNSPQDYQVVLNVTSATTAVIPNPEPAGLVFVSAGSAVASQTITVYASSRTPLPFQASASASNGNWLSLNSAAGSGSTSTTGTTSAGTPGSITVNASPAGLAAGVYRGLISVASGSSVRSVNVTLIVESSTTGHEVSSSAARPKDTPACASGQLVPTETSLVDNFSVPTAWPTPISIQMFDTCGNVIGNAQIVATFTNGDPPLPLISINSTSGLYSGTWTPRKASSQVTITASASAPGYPGAQVKIAGQAPPNSAPVLAPNGAGDVFDPQVGAGLGPGNIIQIYGSSLATLTTTPAVLPLPTTVTGTSVIIGGVQSPLFYVSPTQINAQIPFTLTAGNQYQLLVSANGALTTPLPLQLNAGAPSVLNFSSGAVVAQHLDGTLVLPTSPAVPGEYIVIYSSGLGATDIQVPSGAPSPSNPPANVANPPVLTLNGNPYSILFAGLTPGLVGLYQVNFQVPMTLPAGNYTLQLTQGTTSSNTTVLSVAVPQSSTGMQNR